MTRSRATSSRVRFFRSAAALLLSLDAAAAFAESAPGYLPIFDGGMKSVGLQLGVAKPTPTNGADSLLKSGPGLGIQYIDYQLDWVGLGLELDYLKFGKNSYTTRGVDISGEAAAMSLSTLVRLNLLQERSWTPYLFGGAGYHSSSLKLGAKGPPGTQTCLTFGSEQKCGADPSLEPAMKGLSVTGGAGIEAFILRGMSLALEARFQQLRKGSDADGALESLSCFFGARFLFGLE